MLNPLFDPLFLDCSYGCRTGIGVDKAVERVARYAAQGLDWVVDADITSYFDHIDQRILLGLLRQRVREPAILRLVAQWLRAGTTHADAQHTVAPFPLSRGRQWLQALLSDEDDEAEDEGMPQWWTAVTLARPMVRGAQRVWPVVQQFGKHRVAVAGAAVAGTVMVGELLRRWASTHQRGTPQGGALSPLLANVYLHPFDLALTAHGLPLVRFMDDLVVMCPSQGEAERALHMVERQLATLHLTLNPNKTQIVRYADGLEFLGKALAPPQHGSRLAQGAATFEQARRALQEVGAKVRRRK